MGIFGHGNVTGLGEALEYGGTSLRYIQGNNEQGLVHAATAFGSEFMLVPVRLGRVPQI